MDVLCEPSSDMTDCGLSGRDIPSRPMSPPCMAFPGGPCECIPVPPLDMGSDGPPREGSNIFIPGIDAGRAPCDDGGLEAEDKTGGKNGN